MAILLVPQAIAYAYLAGMPPQYGLYAALIPILIYSLLGTSPHLAIGPVAITAILILAGVGKIAEPFSSNYIELVILAGLMIGVFQVLLGLLKLGRYLNLLSYPVITGFTSAASLIVIISHLKDVLNISTPRSEYLVKTLVHIVSNLHQTHYLTLAFAVISFLTIFLLKRLNKKIPSSLIVVILGIGLSYFFDFTKQGVEIIGFVPEGLPSFQKPSITISNMITLIPTVLMVGIIGIIESVGIAKSIENKNKYYEIDANKELIALGTSKIGGSFFNALPSSGSFSRSALLHEAKGRTTIASIITLIFVTLSLLFLTPLLYFLPKVILAVIIIYAVKNLFEYQLAKKLFKFHKYDFAVMLVTFLVTLLVSIELGVAVGFFISIFNLKSTKHSLPKAIFRIFSQNYKQDIHCANEKYNELKTVIKIEETLHFGNANFFKDLVKEKLSKEEKLQEIKIQFSKNVVMDYSAIKCLKEVRRLLISKDIDLIITSLSPKLNQKFDALNIQYSEA